MRTPARLTDAIRSRAKTITYFGAAAALLGVGTATAASAATVPAAHTPVAIASLSRTAAARAAAQDRLIPVVQHAVADVPAKTGPAKTGPAKTGPAKTGPAKTVPAKTAPVNDAAKSGGAHGSAKPATPSGQDMSWAQVERVVASHTAEPKGADQLLPVGTAGPQAWMPVSGAQLANATAIVKQALAKEMGLRSAVIAVATSMQESQLQNINYGDRDSLGLFQQRPSCGWGSAKQILTPKFAANAFLGALRAHQASDPTWVKQPLWANAQAVQESGFPFAYAKWETQAAHLVKQIVSQVH
jgi:hypothetical protein